MARRSIALLVLVAACGDKPLPAAKAPPPPPPAPVETAAKAAPPPPAKVADAATAKVLAAAVAGPQDYRPIPAKAPQGFPAAGFVKVRGFAYDLEVDGPPVCRTPLREDGGPCKTVEWPGALLSSEQTERLVGLLKERKTYSTDVNNCFTPHHGFVFYDAKDTPVGFVSVCFMCEDMVARPAPPSVKPFGDMIGMTKASITALRALCMDIGLPKCDAKPAIGRAAAP